VARVAAIPAVVTFPKSGFRGKAARSEKGYAHVSSKTTPNLVVALWSENWISIIPLSAFVGVCLINLGIQNQKRKKKKRKRRGRLERGGEESGVKVQKG